MKIISRRERIEIVEYVHNFYFKTHPGSWGFAFECTESGELLNMNPCAQSNYDKCLTGIVDGAEVYDAGIERRERHYTEPAVGICEHCQREVVLDGFTNTCDCGADYNMSGQLLASRSQWGEETGESLSDILRIP